jgi:putative heme-binding domain-containing protein
MRSLAVSTLALLCASALRADDLGLKVPPGFKVTLWADHELANDIYSMTLDDRGRVVVSSRGWVKRLEDTKNAGKADKATTLLTTASGAMGLAFDGQFDLHICGDGAYSRYEFRRGQYATPDDGSQPLNKPTQEFIRLRFGEHGGHQMRKGPDGCWYIIGGNDAEIAKVKLDPSSPIKNPEAGGILRFSKDMKKVECIAHGFRNPYRFDFTPLGDIITYDSDTERDYLLPWYSPTRMYHVAYGQHHGWRVTGYLRSLARRDYYADTADILAPIGRGSPTGVVCYRHYQFPKHYRGGVFALDWTFGKIWFIPLEPDGSSYKTKPELFLEPEGGNGFAPTDACVAPDGSLFVCIGGRGTRGAIYRIEYVGTKKEPREEWNEPKDDIDKVLDAPQPLEAWSRAKWEPIALDIGRAGLVKSLCDGGLPTEKLVRAIEITVEMFPAGLHDAAQSLMSNRNWQVRSRLAWALARVRVGNRVHLLCRLALDNHPKVRVEALDTLGDLLGTRVPDKNRRNKLRDLLTAKEQEALVPVLIDNLGHADKRVRMAACRLIPLFDVVPWVLTDTALAKGPLRARLDFALADHWHGAVQVHLRSIKERTILEALKSANSELRLDALRLLMLLDGDWCLNLAPAEVYSAYSLLDRPSERREIEKEIRDQIRKLFPTGDRNFDIEAGRYLAMIEDDDPQTVVKVIGRFTKESAATDDVHHLIVLSRLHGKRGPEQTRIIADALLGLEKKWQGYQLRIKQTWAPRLAEVVANLVKQHPDLPAALMKDPRFVHPSFVVLADAFGKADRQKAARLFLEAVKKDSEFIWSAELIDLLAALPPEEYRPIFRKKWSDYSLREAILPRLLEMPEAADRQRFLDGLDSPQREMTIKCIEALQQLPRDSKPEYIVPILRRLRLAIIDAKDHELREMLLDVINRNAGTEFANLELLFAKPKTYFTDPLKIKQLNAPVFAWFEQKHPNEAKLLRGDEDDPGEWSKRLAVAPWEKGDAERGVKLFRERSCLACHSGSSRIGPDLTGVAGRFSRDDLFTAIIFPSRDVAPAYRVNDIETMAGKRISGMVVFESADGVIVQTGANTTVRVDAADIASRKPSPKSLMPAGLLKDLKPEDLADLYAFLKSLKNGP